MNFAFKCLSCGQTRNDAIIAHTKLVNGEMVEVGRTCKGCQMMHPTRTRNKVRASGATHFVILDEDMQTSFDNWLRRK